jgi:hypothetical protein
MVALCGWIPAGAPMPTERRTANTGHALDSRPSPHPSAWLASVSRVVRSWFVLSAPDSGHKKTGALRGPVAVVVVVVSR